MLPKNLQTVITKNAGHIVPKELLQLILTKKPNVFGYVVQDGEGLSVGREEGTPEMVDLETMNTETVDFRSILTFGWMDEGFNKEDIQPFALYDGENPFLAFALEGDFPKYDTNNGRTQEFNLVSEIIAPSLSDICELTGGDVEKLMAAIGKPMFNNNFLAAIGHRGVLKILAPTGDFAPVQFKNELGEVYDWGTTSMRHGFGDVKQEPVKVEEKKPRFSFGNKKPVASGQPPIIPKDVATAGTAPRASVPAVKAEEKKHEGPMPVRPPNWCHNNDDKRTFYQMVAGNLPSGWKKNIPVIPLEGAVIPSKIEDLNEWRANRKKATIAATTVTPAPAATATATGPVKTAEEVKQIKAEDNAPIIPAKSMEKVLDFLAKHIDGQSVQMVNPTEIQAIEKKIGTFSEATGTTAIENINLPVGALVQIGKIDIMALLTYALEYRALYRNTLKMEDLVGTEKPKVTTTETKIGDTGKKVESVANEPAPKKKMFSFGKNKAA